MKFFKEVATKSDNATAKFLARNIKTFGEKECNGDEHPNSVDKFNKYENASQWSRDMVAESLKLEKIVSKYGLKVTFTGLYPSLLNQNFEYLEIFG